MSQPVDSKYKSHELNLYSADGGSQLVVSSVPIEISGAGTPAFQLQYLEPTLGEEYPIVVKGLHVPWYNPTGYVPVQNKLMDIDRAIEAENKRATDAETKLGGSITTNYAELDGAIYQEMLARVAQVVALQNGPVFYNNRDTNLRVDAEIKRAELAESSLLGALGVETTHRTNADDALSGRITTVANDLLTETKAREGDVKTVTNALGAEVKARADADGLIQIALLNINSAAFLLDADYKLAVSEEMKRAMAAEAAELKRATERENLIDTAVMTEGGRAMEAEYVLTTGLTAENKRATEKEAKLDARIDFITANIDSAAIDSLSEIVAQFSTNGQGYADRLAYLEGVVQALLNR
jgi:hypothetical protein